ncbi:unnamed protein product [Danaus chrysippus]|uniref:(African queen) hypothetical protein n=1 Tax=Danaus chrysippus TaxID=151541 RepID=A0A8J2QTA2_9NEOP|nr:unnamed protein product [Danaus chrysippus]
MVTMQFEYDPERLIEEIKKRPGIWDFDNIEYKTKSTRHKLWADVVNELIKDDVTITKSERRELEIQLQKKWKGIRDCFQKYLTNPNKSKRPYLYSRQLQFLFKDSKDTQNNEAGSSESEEGRTKTVWKPTKKLSLKKEGFSEEYQAVKSIDNDDYRSNEEVSMEVPVKHSGGHGKNATEEFAFACVDTQNRTEQEDPDKLFLLSLLPHIKTIPEEMRLNVKMDIMQVLRNGNYQSVSGHDII